jgi:F420H(2)-dependent quinone reductase
MPEPSDPNTGIIEEFRANGGKVGGYFEGATLLILHTKGVKTGLARMKPLDYLPDGERFVVFGTKGGAPTDPYWVRNVLGDAEPRSSSPTVSFRCGRWRSPGPRRRTSTRGRWSGARGSPSTSGRPAAGSR